MQPPSFFHGMLMDAYFPFGYSAVPDSGVYESYGTVAGN